jgi:hypothetical protein
MKMQSSPKPQRRFDYTPPKVEEVGSPYFFRASMGGSADTRMREIYGNDYGKTAQRTGNERAPAGVPVSPRRTMIGG